MSLESLAVIGEALARCAIARGGSADDVTVDVYLERLKAFSPDVVREACDHWADVPRGDRDPALPPAADLIATIREIERTREQAERARFMLPAPSRDEDGPRYACLECFDAFWITARWCPGVGNLRASGKADRHAALETRVCHRTHPHPAHTFTRKCGCVDTNPVIARHREARAVRKVQPRRSA